MHKIWAALEKAPLKKMLIFATITVCSFLFFLLITGLAKNIINGPSDQLAPGAAFYEEGIMLKNPPVNWTMYGYDKRRNNYLAVPELKSPGRLIWKFPARKLLEFSPVLHGNMLFLLRIDGILWALNKKTGKVIWKRKVARLTASTPTWDQGILYVTSLKKGKIMALKAQTGKTIWSQSIGSRSESSPLIVGNRLIFGDEGGYLWCLNKKTGRLFWRRELRDSIKGGVAFNGGNLFVADYSGSIWSFSLKGKKLWRNQSNNLGFGRRGSFYATPALAFGRIYIGSTDGRMYSFVAKNGQLAWSHNTGDYVYSSAAVGVTPKSPPTVYFGSYNRVFYALNARSGIIRWQRRLGGQISGAPSLIGETVITANLRTGKTAFLKAKNGHITRILNDGAYNPMISDGTYWFFTGLKTIYAFKQD